MAKPDLNKLSRRERQIMDQLFRLAEGSVGDVKDSIDDPPSYSTLRAIMGILVEKGYLTRRHEGPKYIYRPTLSKNHARTKVMKHMLKTFFDDSIESAVATLINVSGAELSDQELARLAKLINEAREEGR